MKNSPLKKYVQKILEVFNLINLNQKIHLLKVQLTTPSKKTSYHLQFSSRQIQNKKLKQIVLKKKFFFLLFQPFRNQNRSLIDYSIGINVSFLHTYLYKICIKSSNIKVNKIMIRLLIMQKYEFIVFILYFS